MEAMLTEVRLPVGLKLHANIIDCVLSNVL